MRLKVLIIGGSLPPELREGHDPGGGYSKAVWNIARSIALTSSNIEITLMPFHLAEKVDDYLRVCEVSIGALFPHKYRLGFGRSYKQIKPYIDRRCHFKTYAKNLVVYSNLARLLEKCEFDLVHIHGVTPEFFSIFELVKKFSKRLLLTLHGIYSTDSSIYVSFDKRFEFDACRKYLDIGAEVSTVSEFTSRQLEQHLGLISGSVHTIENGIDLRFFQEQRNQSDEIDLREKLGIPSDGYIALSVGSISKLKNQELYIRTLENLNNPRTHYILVGDGTERRKLESVVKSGNLRNRIHFLGNKGVAELIELYDACDYLVHLPSSEGFGLIYAEALVRGKPILTFAELPFPKKFLNSRIAVLCESSRIDSVQEATFRMLERLSSGSFDKEEMVTVSKHFHPSRMATDYISLYSRLL